MKTKLPSVTFRMTVKVDRYDSTVPTKVISRLEEILGRRMKVQFKRGPYPARLIVSNVGIKDISFVYGALSCSLEGFNELKGFSINQERAEW